MILLDTHVVYSWAMGRQRRLTAAQRRRLDEVTPSDPVLVSVLSLFEVGNLVRLGLVRVGIERFADLVTRVRALPIIEVGLESDAALAALALPESLTDPIDRLLVATAIELDVPLMTSDGRIVDSGTVETIV